MFGRIKQLINTNAHTCFYALRNSIDTAFDGVKIIQQVGSFAEKITPANKTVVWVGRFDDLQKRPRDALRVMAEVVQKCEGARLVMVGTAGSEGADALVNALWGKVPFVGRLPFTWPVSSETSAEKESRRSETVLFPYGFGL